MPMDICPPPVSLVDVASCPCEQDEDNAPCLWIVAGMESGGRALLSVCKGLGKSHRTQRWGVGREPRAGSETWILDLTTCSVTLPSPSRSLLISYTQGNQIPPSLQNQLRMRHESHQGPIVPVELRSLSWERC